MHLGEWWWVFAELIPGEDKLVFAESPEVFVCQHPVLNQPRCEFLQHLTGDIQVINNKTFPVLQSNAADKQVEKFTHTPAGHVLIKTLH